MVSARARRVKRVSHGRLVAPRDLIVIASILLSRAHLSRLRPREEPCSRRRRIPRRCRRRRIRRHRESVEVDGRIFVRCPWRREAPTAASALSERLETKEGTNDKKKKKSVCEFYTCRVMVLNERTTRSRGGARNRLHLSMVLAKFARHVSRIEREIGDLIAALQE